MIDLRFHLGGKPGGGSFFEAQRVGLAVVDERTVVATAWGVFGEWGAGGGEPKPAWENRFPMTVGLSVRMCSFQRLHPNCQPLRYSLTHAFRAI